MVGVGLLDSGSPLTLRAPLPRTCVTEPSVPWSSAAWHLYCYAGGLPLYLVKIGDIYLGEYPVNDVCPTLGAFRGFTLEGGVGIIEYYSWA